MTNLFKFEFHKLWRQKSFYICLAVSIVLVILNILLLVLLSGFLEKVAEDEEALNLFTTIYTGSNAMILALTQSNYLLIAGIFASIFACSDFENQTLKNVYAKGYSRTETYFAKLITLIAALLIFFVADLLCGFIFGLALTKDAGNFSPAVLIRILGQFLIIITSSCIFFSVGTMLKKVSRSILLCILGPLVISIVLSIFERILKTDVLFMQSFWIDGALATFSSFETDTQSLIISFIMPVVYAVGFTYLGLSIHKKAEI